MAVCLRAPGLPTENTVTRAKYVNAKPVYFPKNRPQVR